MHAADALYLRLARRRAFMVEQFVVLERERQGTATRMADDVDPRLGLDRGQSARQRHGLNSADRLLQAQQARIMPIGRRGPRYPVHEVASLRIHGLERDL